MEITSAARWWWTTTTTTKTTKTTRRRVWRLLILPLVVVVLVVLTIVLSVLGAKGILGGKGIDGEGDDGRMRVETRDGLSRPWYPSPRGGTVQSWTESYEKAQELVGRMSVVEKVNVTTGVGWQMGLCVGNTGPASSVGFPSLCLQDGPLGIRFADNISAFPAGVTVGATWSRDLMYKRGFALGKEARLKGVNILLGPAMGPIGVLPAGGRNWEGFGSDPVLQGVAAAETIRGVQDNGVMATAKHYVLNEQEHFRQEGEWGIPIAMSSNIDDRSLREVYVWPFAESVRAGVASVMCAYQMVNNSYACQNSLILNGILKDELGFQGFVQSDWLAQRSGVASALAGLDVSMPGDGLGWADGISLWGHHLTQAVLNTSVPMDRLNDMATRVVASWYQLKQDSWAKPPPDGDEGPNFSSWTHDRIGRLHQGSPDDDAKCVVNQYINAQGEGDDAHGPLAREIAAEATILLKNENGFLPLSRDGPGLSDEKYRIGIYGEDAGAGDGPNACADRACNQGTLASGWGSGAVDFPYLITPWKALSRAFNNKSTTVSGYLTNDRTPPEDMRDKDLCLVFANADSGEGFASWKDIRGDRNDLILQKGTDSLVSQVATECGAGNGSTVVVIHSVGPVIVESWIDLPGVKAVLLANLPGEESGNALADILFGDVDASGRLPYTMGKNLTDYGPEAGILYKSDDVIPQKDFSHGLYIDYRYFDAHNLTPRYEFGYGLSYTTFNLSNLILRPLKSKTPLPSPRPKENSPPWYNTTIPNVECALFPEKFRVLTKYIYPYLSSVDDIKREPPYEYPKGYDEAQPPSPAGGGEGGNPSLFEPFVTVSVTVSNTGTRVGKEVVQVYVSFPENVLDEPILDNNSSSSSNSNNNNSSDSSSISNSPNNNSTTTNPSHNSTRTVDFPLRVLRNFNKVEVQPGQNVTVSLPLTRKDLSYWSAVNQNWVMPVSGKFQVWVGRSSRDLPLMAEY
ncbi:beta-glucosidase [Blastomyces gilchristii SLH14081]|uniref:Probable beta-glucosidase E n=1 Tax=Blastomyces gilchristii (strain SLH14081) TaxID=559298 RepID=A0A179UNC7_BLAGS|nr:beta-glucosidase [Blastomyces gilchristii SLH14081]OAT09586.1 beta-glucosidase [Blastomyces gilchristii SLH14081]